MQDRLSTGDRTKIWAGLSNCVLCDDAEESRNHLFFECRYASMVWRSLTRQLLGNHYTANWRELMTIIKGDGFTFIHKFIVRYTFQTIIYYLWRERNGRRHGEQPQSPRQLERMVYKTIRNRLSTLRRTPDQRYRDGLIRRIVLNISNFRLSNNY